MPTNVSQLFSTVFKNQLLSPTAGNRLVQHQLLCLRDIYITGDVHKLSASAPNPDRVLIDAAKRKVSNYRLDYLQDGKAFLPLIASTSGRLHGEFVRFLYFLAHKRAMDFFAAIGQAHPSHNELCQQRGAFFYQHRSRVGVACAQACALRIGGACSTTPASATSGRQRACVAGGPRCTLGWIIDSLMAWTSRLLVLLKICSVRLFKELVFMQV